MKSIFKKWILHKWLQNLLKSVYFLPKLTYGLIFFCLISGLSPFWMLIKIAKYLWILGKIWKPLMILVAPNHPNLYNYMHYRAWSSNTIKALGMHFYREKIPSSSYGYIVADGSGGHQKTIQRYYTLPCWFQLLFQDMKGNLRFREKRIARYRFPQRYIFNKFLSDIHWTVPRFFSLVVIQVCRTSWTRFEVF